MEIFGQKIKKGYSRKEERNGYIEYKTEKLLKGYRIEGKVRGNLKKVKVLTMEKPKEKLYLNNWQSWGPFTEEQEYRMVMDAHKKRRIGVYTYTPIPEAFTKESVSDYFIAGDNIIIGFLTSKIAHPYFIIKEDSIEAYLEYFDTRFEEPIELEPLVILSGLPLHKLLRIYGDFVKRENNVGIFSEVPIGWSTWYQYFLNLTWGDIDKNLRLSKKMNMPYKVFQIDDGYEKDIGEWTSVKEGFPSISEMAETIRSYGYTPGIWTAPLSIGETSEIYDTHKDWLVKGENGPKKAYYNWERNIYTLDITHQDAKNWLYETFLILKKAGFNYFKIDFMFTGALPGKRKKTVTPIQAYREALSVIKEAVGESFILGCGAPLLPSVGFVDGMRVEPDTAPYWEKDTKKGDINAYWALKNTITRWFMHKKWWVNDPDCLILRNSDTQLTPSQKEVYAIVSGILDNMIIQSDDLSYIKEEEKSLFEKVISFQGGRPKVKFIDNDLFVISKEGGSGNIKIAVNLDNKSASWKQREVPPNSYIVLEDDIESTSLTKKIIKREDGRIFTYYEGED